MTTRSTRDGSRAFSSRLDTRLDGDTSNSESNLEDEGAYVCRDDG